MAPMGGATCSPSPCWPLPLSRLGGSRSSGPWRQNRLVMLAADDARVEREDVGGQRRVVAVDEGAGDRRAVQQVLDIDLDRKPRQRPGDDQVEVDIGPGVRACRSDPGRPAPRTRPGGRCRRAGWRSSPTADRCCSRRRRRSVVCGWLGNWWPEMSAGKPTPPLGNTCAGSNGGGGALRNRLPGRCRRRRPASPRPKLSACCDLVGDEGGGDDAIVRRQGVGLEDDVARHPCRCGSSRRSSMCRGRSSCPDSRSCVQAQMAGRLEDRFQLGAPDLGVEILVDRGVRFDLRDLIALVIVEEGVAVQHEPAAQQRILGPDLEGVDIFGGEGRRDRTAGVTMPVLGP